MIFVLKLVILVYYCFAHQIAFTPSPSTELACLIPDILLQIVLGLRWVGSQSVFVYFDEVFACADLTPTLFY